MTDPLQHLPIDQIDASALPRDRSHDDDEALHELELSITASGLRQPIEVWALSRPDATRRYGLISGFRRLAACRALGHDTIAAFLRQPRDVPDAMAAMVAENEVRAQVSAWEKGRLILDCVGQGLFDTPDAAIRALYPLHSRQKQCRLRSLCIAVEAFDDALATPERLTVARIERLASALRAGWEEMLHTALRPVARACLDTQWSALEPVIHEALNPGAEPLSSGPDRPRRILRLRKSLTIRRELTRTGWALKFTGPEARTPGLMDDVMTEIERWFGQD